MTYLYRCEDCGATREIRRPVEQRDDLATCSACRWPMRRVFSPPMMNTNRWGYDTFPVGLSSKDVADDLKSTDAAYEESWNGTTPAKKPKTEFRDIYREVAQGAME